MDLKKRLTGHTAPRRVSQDAAPQGNQLSSSSNAFYESVLMSPDDSDSSYEFKLERLSRFGNPDKLEPQNRNADKLFNASTYSEEKHIRAPQASSELLKAMEGISSGEVNDMKRRLLCRLSELKSSFTSVSTKKTTGSNDFTTTGVFLDDLSYTGKVTARENTTEENEVSAMIRSICRDRSNYDLLVSAVLNISDRTSPTLNEGEYYDEESLGSFESEAQGATQEDLAASFGLQSSVSSLTRDQESIRKKPKPRRRKSSEFLGSLVAMFTRNTKLNLTDRQLSNDVIGNFVYTHSKTNAGISPKYDESKGTAYDFSAWSSRLHQYGR